MGRQKRRTKKSKRGGFNFKLLFSILLPLLLVLLLIYSFFTIATVKTSDPIQENIPGFKILSDIDDDVQGTVFLFEREKGEKRRIADVYVLLTNKKKESSLLIYIPGSLYFNGLEEDFGAPIAISSLRYAGEFLQEGRGVEYALWQISEILGFKVDSYVWITTEAYEVLSEVYGDMNEVKEKYKEAYEVEQDITLSESFFKLHSLSNKVTGLKTLFNFRKVKNLDETIYSDMSFVNTLRMIERFENVVNTTNTNSLDMGSAKYSIEEFSDRGGQIRSINISEYDKVLREYMFDMLDKEVEKERVRVEVYNGSKGCGRAGAYARKILNNGCDVVRFGNAPESIEKTQVYISDENAFENSLEIVSEVLMGRFEIVYERPSFMTTGDIVVLIGEDISQIEIF
jgi:hypothetical protein